jgi:hypothetical protein
MGKHGKLVNVLMKLHFIEDSQRGVRDSKTDRTLRKEEC